MITSQNQRLATKPSNCRNIFVYYIHCLGKVISVDRNVTNICSHQRLKWRCPSGIVVRTEQARFCSYLSWTKAVKKESGLQIILLFLPSLFDLLKNGHLFHIKRIYVGVYSLNWGKGYSSEFLVEVWHSSPDPISDQNKQCCGGVAVPLSDLECTIPEKYPYSPHGRFLFCNPPPLLLPGNSSLALYFASKILACKTPLP